MRHFALIFLFVFNAHAQDQFIARVLKVSLPMGIGSSMDIVRYEDDGSVILWCNKMGEPDPTRHELSQEIAARLQSEIEKIKFGTMDEGELISPTSMFSYHVEKRSGAAQPIYSNGFDRGLSQKYTDGRADEIIRILDALYAEKCEG